MSTATKKIKSMIDLESGDCRWPIGDPRHHDFHFCGAKQAPGRPYCAHHWGQSFVTRARNDGKAQPKPAVAITVDKAA